MTTNKLAFLLFAIVALVGCTGGPARLVPPSVSRGAADAAIAEYDANDDGAISGQEIGKVPAFSAARSRIDRDGDGRITADEIEHRIDVWRDSRLVLMQVLVTVRTNGKAVQNAEVTFVPEKWLGSAIMPAQGTTDSNGMANMTISAEKDATGVNPGFYRIEVSKVLGGKETIASRYNAQTELGVEVTPEAMELQNLPIDLRSR